MPSRICRRCFRGGNQLIYVDAAQLKQTTHRIVDQVVGAGRTRRYPEINVPAGQPVFRQHFLLFVKVEMKDLLVRKNLAGVTDKVCRHPLLAHLRQM